jgi:hypothetical protein
MGPPHKDEGYCTRTRTEMGIRLYEDKATHGDGTTLTQYENKQGQQGTRYGITWE